MSTTERDLEQATPTTDTLVGGPGEEPQANPAPDQPEPQRHRVRLAGRDFEVDPELAAALEEREREFQRKLSQQGAELGQLRRLAQSPSVAAASAPTPEPLSTLLFTDPDRFISRFRAEVAQELEARYRQDQAWREFWMEFDRAHPALAGERALAQAVLQEHFTELVDLPVRQAIDRLGELSWKKLTGLVSRAHQTNPEPSRAVVEGGGVVPRSRPVMPPKKEEEGPQSLSQLLRERRARRAASPAKA